MPTLDAEHLEQRAPKPRKPRLVLYYTRYACATCNKLCPTVRDVIMHHMKEHGCVFTLPGPSDHEPKQLQLLNQKAFI